MENVMISIASLSVARIARLVARLSVALPLAACGSNVNNSELNFTADTAEGVFGDGMKRSISGGQASSSGSAPPVVTAYTRHDSGYIDEHQPGKRFARPMDEKDMGPDDLKYEWERNVLTGATSYINLYHRYMVDSGNLERKELNDRLKITLADVRNGLRSLVIPMGRGFRMGPVVLQAALERLEMTPSGLYAIASAVRQLWSLEPNSDAVIRMRARVDNDMNSTLNSILRLGRLERSALATFNEERVKMQEATDVLHRTRAVIAELELNESEAARALSDDERAAQIENLEPIIEMQSDILDETKRVADAALATQLGLVNALNDLRAQAKQLTLLDALGLPPLTTSELMTMADKVIDDLETDRGTMEGKIRDDAEIRAAQLAATLEARREATVRLTADGKRRQAEWDAMNEDERRQYMARKLNEVVDERPQSHSPTRSGETDPVTLAASELSTMPTREELGQFQREVEALSVYRGRFDFNEALVSLPANIPYPILVAAMEGELARHIHRLMVATWQLRTWSATEKGGEAEKILPFSPARRERALEEKAQQIEEMKASLTICQRMAIEGMAGGIWLNVEAVANDVGRVALIDRSISIQPEDVEAVEQMLRCRSIAQ